MRERLNSWTINNDYQLHENIRLNVCRVIIIIVCSKAGTVYGKEDIPQIYSVCESRRHTDRKVEEMKKNINGRITLKECLRKKTR